MYVALKIRFVREHCRFGQNRFVAARSDSAPLMKRQRAETAPAEAAACSDYTEANLLDRRDAAQRFVHWVIRPRVVEIVDLIELGLCKRRSRFVLHNIHAAVSFD